MAFSHGIFDTDIRRKALERRFNSLKKLQGFIRRCQLAEKLRDQSSVKKQDTEGTCFTSLSWTSSALFRIKLSIKLCLNLLDYSCKMWCGWCLQCLWIRGNKRVIQGQKVPHLLLLMCDTPCHLINRSDFALIWFWISSGGVSEGV